MYCVCTRFNRPALTIALVLGGGASLEADVRAALDLGEYSGVVCCNDSGVSWPGPLDCWVSLHTDKLTRTWRYARQTKGFEQAGYMWGPKQGFEKGLKPPLDGWVGQFFEGQIDGGSSGHFALKVALVDLGYDRAVLCGIPMDTSKHFFGGDDWRSATSHRLGWEQTFATIKDRVRSMSGWTRVKFGAPDSNWLR